MAARDYYNAPRHDPWGGHRGYRDRYYDRYDAPYYEDRYYGRSPRPRRATSLGNDYGNYYDNRGALERRSRDYYQDRPRARSLDRRPHHSSRHHRGHHDDRDHHHHHSRRNSPPRHRHRHYGNGQRGASEDEERHRKRNHAARAAVDAGVVEGVRLSREPGEWVGPKGARVATAALGAAVVDAVRDNDPDEHAKRHSVESALGGLLANRLVNGPRRDLERR